MRITRNQLRQVIREELTRHLHEQREDAAPDEATIASANILWQNAESRLKAILETYMNSESVNYNPQHVIDYMASDKGGGVTPDAAYEAMIAKMIFPAPRGDVARNNFETKRSEAGDLEALNFAEEQGVDFGDEDQKAAMYAYVSSSR